MTELSMLKTWLVARLSRSERGANMVEYILLVVFIALVVVVGVKLLGNQAKTNFGDACSNLKGSNC